MYLSVQHDSGLITGEHWVQRDTGIKYVSAGVTGVWGINVNDRVVYRGYDDTSFTPVPGKQKSPTLINGRFPVDMVMPPFSYLH